MCVLFIHMLEFFSGTSGKSDVVLDDPAAVSLSDSTAADIVNPDSIEQVDTGAKDQELSHQDLEELEDVLEVIAEEKKIELEKESLDALKEDVDEYQEVCG